MKIREDKRKEILEILRDNGNWVQEEFIPGKTLVRYSGAVYGPEEMSAFSDSLLEGWFGVGPLSDRFERKFAKYVGCERGLYTNSGSSANLLALSSLCSQKLGDKRLKKYDEVIVGAFCFPTTVTPILTNRLKPVFVDSEVGSYTINPEAIKEAITENTKAVMLTHHLGNPNKLEEIVNICKDNDLYLIEDCCDGLGSKYNEKMIGSFGDASTFSFYPAHHITTGEGGMVLTNNRTISRVGRSIRDWGRDCFCDSRTQNPNGECGRRFNGKFGDLPEGYDHKYIYGEKGFNLKPLEFQAAFGLEQMKRLPEFEKKRKENFQELNEYFKQHEDKFILPKTVDEKADPVWFAYPLTVREDSGFKREDLVKYLEEHKIQTRPFFCGNILRHPLFYGNKDLDSDYRISGNLGGSNDITEGSFFLGVYPGIDKPRRDYMLETLDSFLKNY
jgi:CDP-6-deoxy-D-xylo-4-hexulose-3-dehydrase